MMSQNVVNLVDTAMVGTLGDAALDGTGTGGFMNFVAIAAVMGLSAGVQAMASRRVRYRQPRAADLASIFPCGEPLILTPQRLQQPSPPLKIEGVGVSVPGVVATKKRLWTLGHWFVSCALSRSVARFWCDRKEGGVAPAKKA